MIVQGKILLVELSECVIQFSVGKVRTYQNPDEEADYAIEPNIIDAGNGEI